MANEVEELAATEQRPALAGRDTRAFEGASVTPNRGLSATEYSITGELPNVLKAIQAIFETYPGLGYGTYVKFMTQLSDGTYGAQIGRSNSCD